MVVDSSSTKPATTAAVSSAARLYSPYQDLDSPAVKIYYLPTSLEHLYPKEAPKPYRNWSDNLMYNANICYLSNGAVSSVIGLARGLKAADASESRKLWLSHVLSSRAAASMRFSNNMGILWLYYSVIESGIDSYTGEEGVLNSCLAGYGDGALYKAARGVRGKAVGV